MYPCRRAYASCTCLCVSLSSLTSGIGTPEVWKSTLADVPPLRCTFKSPQLWCDRGEMLSVSDMHVGISDTTAGRAGNTPFARGDPSVLYWALGIRLREYVAAHPGCPLCGQNCLSASEVQVHDHTPSSYIQGFNMPDAGPLRPCATHTHSSGKPTAVQPVQFPRSTLWLLTGETRNLNHLRRGTNNARKRASSLYSDELLRYVWDYLTMLRRPLFDSSSAQRYVG